MGLLANHKTSSGISVSNAYSRIENISISKDDCAYTLTTYLSRDAFLSGKSYLTIRQLNFTADIKEGALNIYKQVYMFVKSIEEFQFSEDVFEE